MRPFAIAVFCLALSGPALSAEKLAADSPLAQVLVKADVDKDGLVTVEELDAAMTAMHEANLKEAQASWTRTLRFIGLPDTAESFLASQHVAAVDAMFRRADAMGDGDGIVTRDEVFALAGKESDADIRVDMSSVFEIADADKDGNVTVQEREILVTASAGPDVPPIAIATILETLRTNADSDTRLAAEFLQGNGDAEGRVRLSDVIR